MEVGLWHFLLFFVYQKGVVLWWPGKPEGEDQKGKKTKTLKGGKDEFILF